MVEMNQVEMWQQAMLMEQMRQPARNPTPQLASPVPPTAAFAAPGPTMYRAIQEPAPVTGGAFPAVDAILGMTSPWIGRQFLGMQNPISMPQMQPGFGAFDAWYASQVTTPLIETAQAQNFWQMGGAMGSTLGQMGTMAGLPGLLGMSPQKFRENMVGFGQSEPGQALMQSIMGTPALDAIMGGNPLEMQNRLLGARHQLGAPIGSVINPLDTQMQTLVTERTNEFYDQIRRDIYTDPVTGMGGITPNPEVTRGFKVEDLGTMTTRMAAGGVSAMRGTAPGQMTAGFHEMVRTMESLGDLVGSRDMDVLFNSLEKITQGNWRTMDRAGLTRNFRQMGAEAKLLDMDNPTYLGMQDVAQQTMQATLGITPELAALGVTGGGYTTQEATGVLRRRIGSVAVAQGATRDPRKLRQIAAQQSALLNIGMNSPIGRDLRQIGYLAEQNPADTQIQEQFAQMQRAAETGDSGTVRTIADEVLRMNYGSAATGRAMMNDPNMRQRYDEGTRLNAPAVVEAIMAAQRGEYGNRLQDVMQDRMGNTVDVIAGGTRGLSGRLAGGELAGVRQQATMDYLTGLGDKGVGLAKSAEDVYDRAIARGESPQSAMADMQNFIGSSGAFNVGQREGVARAQKQAVNRENATRMQNPMATAANVMGAEIGEAYNTGLTADQRTALLTLEGEGAKIRAIEDPTARAEALEAHQAKWTRFKGGLGDEQRATVEAAGVRRGNQVAQTQANLKRDAEVDRRMQYGKSMGMGEMEVVAAQGDVLEFLRAFQGGGITKGAALEQVWTLPTLFGDPGVAKGVKSAIEAGKGSDELKDLISSQERIVQSSRQAGQRLGGLRFGGVSGAPNALAAQAEADAIYDMVTKEAGPLGGKTQEIANANAELYRSFPELAVGVMSGTTSMARLLQLTEGPGGNAMLERAQKFGRLGMSLHGVADIDVGAMDGGQRKYMEGALETILGEKPESIQEGLNRVAVMSRERIGELDKQQRGALAGVGKISVEQMEARSPAAVAAATGPAAAIGGLTARWFQGDKRSKINNALETILGDDSGSMAEGLTRVSKMSKKEIGAMSEDQRIALFGLQRMEVAQSAKIKDDEKRATKGGGADAITLSGTLILKSPDGATLGQVEDVRQVHGQ